MKLQYLFLLQTSHCSAQKIKWLSSNIRGSFWLFFGRTFSIWSCLVVYWFCSELDWIVTVLGIKIINITHQKTCKLFYFNKLWSTNASLECWVVLSNHWKNLVDCTYPFKLKQSHISWDDAVFFNNCAFIMFLIVCLLMLYLLDKLFLYWF